MARSDDFKISPDDGFRYAAPEKDRDREAREGGYIILVLLVALVMLATATGQITVFYY